VREVPADEWDELLAELGCADAYLLRAYVEASCVLDPGEPVLLHAEDTVMACIVRPIAGSDLRDVTTPYGYGGPVGGGADFSEEYETWCTERGIVSTFVRYHPLFENYRSGRFNASYASPTVGWPLEGDLLAGMHGKHRNTIRKAERAGVAVEAAPSVDLATFAALYETTMQRQEAARYYFFPPAYWERLGALGDRLVLFDAIHEGGVVASALCMRGNRWLHYHLGATHNSARELGASNLLLYEAALWGQERGLETFHLGGGAGGHEDSLFAFKHRFSPDGLREFWTGRAVHDEHAYRELSGGSEVDFDGFFPAYRA
jgi:Acetyltransferase (GNAT) domain